MKACFLLLFIFSISHIKAQDTNFINVKPAPLTPKKLGRNHSNNAFYFELLGSTYGIGISYERKIISTPSLTLNARFGIGSLILINAFPTFGFNALVGKEKHFLEIGFNATRTYGIDLFGGQGNIIWIGNPILGYRFISTQGFVFRLSFTPLVNTFDDDFGSDFFPFGGLSIGKTF